MELAEHTCQLNHMIKLPMTKPSVGIMLSSVIIADKQISGLNDPCFNGCP
jgi:hypothetical protein